MQGLFLTVLNRPGFPGGTRRLLEPIGNIPPAEAEAAYYQRIDMQQRAA